MLTVGIIGLGMIGRIHLAAWAKTRGARVAMVADPDPRRAAGDLSGSWSNIGSGADSLGTGSIRGTTDPLELIHDPAVDIVDICAPTPAHPDLALAALRAGKHVLCEKPLARTSAAALRIASAAASARGTFMPAMCMRFWPQWAWLARAVRSGSHGRVIAASFRRIGSMPPGWFRDSALSGGALLDLHLHDTDFIHYVFGPPSAVSSGGWTGPGGGIDHIHTRYLYPDGPVVAAEGSWAASPVFPFDMAYRVHFEKGTADYQSGRAGGGLLLHGNRKSQAVKCPAGDGYTAELAYFVRCIRRNQAPAICTAVHAAHSIRIAEAEEKSVLTGRNVRVSGA